jgi:squalene-hopene/tetraprenyl-beta-curcumene cyclase
MPLRVRALVLAVILTLPGAALAAGDEHAEKARAAMTKAVAWLRAQQDKATGGWSVPPAQPDAAPGQGPPVYPAITGLAINAMLLAPDVTATDPAVTAGIEFLIKHQQPDGGIYDRVLPSYNTSIALSALARVPNPSGRVKGAIVRAQEFLRGLQWSERSVNTAGAAEAPQPVAKDHPFYGGVGYGKHGRPDLSNLGIMLQALHDSGVSPDDDSFKRALTFLQRVQMLDSVNDMPYADGSKQGGFVYSTVPNAQSVEGRAGQSMAGEMEETMDDGTKVSRLRAYGSMTYNGFKSYLYAGLTKDDPRVRAAYDWLRRHYSTEENPGMGASGLYYYFVTMSRGLKAAADNGPTTIEVIKDEKTETRNWANDLIDRLAGLQSDEGSFKVVDKRWMEDNDVLITAYGLIALGEALEAKEAAAAQK